MSIHNNLSRKNYQIKRHSVQLLIKQKRKIKRAFIKARNSFLKSALKAITKQNKKPIKSRGTANIQKRIQSLQLTNDPKSWRTLKKKKWVTQVKEILIWT